MSLKNKIVLITGASSGIGTACARALAERGYSVIASGRNEQRIQSLAESINGRFIVADLNDTNQIEKLFSEAGEQIDILINSAGVAPKAPIINGDLSNFRELLNVNVLALTLCCQFALKKFDPDKGGHIINLSSMSGHRVPPSGGFYAATKFAVKAVTEALRFELKASNNKTRVAMISPGFVDTPLLDLYFKGDEEKLEKLKNEIHMLDPINVAESVTHIIESPSHVEIGDIQLRPSEQGI
jgi:NADP-dependent 3-hydroxy acid dehydrogenase YdfG|tara:strand:- start:308 stop:1030 length:723 start_codon:yes stop_codon:yes gene_type:complete